MSRKKRSREAMRCRRKLRIRSKIEGTPERPRLSVFRSATHVTAQVIDDLAGKTLAAVTSIKKGQTKRANKAQCTALGKLLAERCKEKSILKVVFDKNGYAYHGRIKALADGAREAGLQF